MRIPRRGKALAALGLVACSNGSIPGEIVTRSRHVELHAAPDRAVCSQSLAHVDDFIEATSAYVDEPPPLVTYYLYNGDVDGGCRIIAQAGESFDCTHITTVYAAIWPHYHEVVHTIIASWGRPPAFLAEGIAEGLGGVYPSLSPDERARAEIELDSVAFYASNAAAHYVAAGDFAVYLLDRFGVARMKKLAKSTLYLDDSIAIHATFSDVLGVDLDRAIADWRQAPPVATTSLPRFRSACESTPVATVPGPWLASDTLDCRSTNSTLTLSELAYYPFDVAEPGLYVWGLTQPSPPNTGLYFLPCALDDLPHRYYESPHAVTAFALDVGRHLLMFDRFSDDPTPVTVDIGWQLAPFGPLGADCASAPTYASTDDEWLFDLELAPSRWPATEQDPMLGTLAGAWLRLDVPATPGWSVKAFVSPGDGEICSGACGSFSSCALLSKNENEITPVAGESLYVHVRAPISDEPATFAAQSWSQNPMATRGPKTNATSRLP